MADFLWACEECGGKFARTGQAKVCPKCEARYLRRNEAERMAYNDGRRVENEACAKLCEEQTLGWYASDGLVSAVRERVKRVWVEKEKGA